LPPIRIAGAHFSPDTVEFIRLLYEHADIPGIETAEELLEEDLASQNSSRARKRRNALSRIDGISFEQAWPERVEAILVTKEGEVPMPYIAIDQLITNKRVAGRPKDLDDLAYLEAAKRKR
jgi:hypothetical protein